MMSLTNFVSNIRHQHWCYLEILMFKRWSRVIRELSLKPQKVISTRCSQRSRHQWWLPRCWSNWRSHQFTRSSRVRTFEFRLKIIFFIFKVEDQHKIRKRCCEFSCRNFRWKRCNVRRHDCWCNHSKYWRSCRTETSRERWSKSIWCIFVSLSMTHTIWVMAYESFTLTI